MRKVSASFSIGMLLVLCFDSASAQTTALGSATRDGASAYINSFNFAIGRIGRECLNPLGRPETPQALISVWNERNARFLAAAQKYREARLDEAESRAGLGARDKLAREFNAATRQQADRTIRAALDGTDKMRVCQQALAAIEVGAYDITSTTPGVVDLQALVSWAN